ncbi:MAG: phosphoribosylanthranilate isomerase [Gammaproteobacteria bacterium]|nr:phosphoribosylanthranilate isomerase [Gammaproteobacteria bacterium]
MNARIKVKVCGMTRPLDVRAAVELGVDAIGVILHANSPRKVDPELAARIRKEIPALVTMVGVYVDADKALINHQIREIGLDLVQLHGQETDEFGRSLDARFIKAIRARSVDQVERDIAAFPNAAAILLDPYVQGQHGGTGTVLDQALWTRAVMKSNMSEESLSASGTRQRLILAGGLSPANLSTAVREVKPWAVDLNSGVEKQPGVKDPELIDAALQLLRR